MVDASGSPIIEGIERLVLVGQGGFARVYRGYQSAFHRTVAVKVLQQSALGEDDQRRFERECQAMGALSHHPNILTLYAAGYTEDGRPYMVMPFVEDGTLQERIRRDSGIPWRDALDIGLSLCGALETSHRAGVLHRDIKPANVLMASYGVQLSDFGIARIVGGHETRSGVITASIAHAPPEILDGSAPSAQSDIYSLGSTLHETIAGRSPFASDGDAGMAPMIRRVMLESPPDLRDSGTPDSVATVIERAMAKDPQDRHASAHEFGEALREAQMAEDSPPAPMPVIPIDPSTIPASTMEIPPASPVEPATAVHPVLANPPDSDVTPPRGRSSPDPGPPVGPALGDRPSRTSRAPKIAAAVGALVVLVGGSVAVASLLRSDGDAAPGESVAPIDESVPATPESTTVAGDPTTTVSVIEASPVPLTLPPGDPVRLEFWHPGIETALVEEMVGVFETENPGITVDVVVPGGYSATLDEAVSASPADRPDVVSLADRGAQAALDLLDHVPVQELIDRDDFPADVLLPSAVATYSTNAGLEAMPFNVSAPILLVNQDVVTTAGIDLEPDADFGVDELLEACDRIGDLVTRCIEFDNNAFMFTEMVENSGGEVFREAADDSGPAVAAFDDPIGRAAFGFLAGIVRDGVGVERSGTALFVEGESAFYMTSSGALGSTDRAVDGQDDPITIGTASFPHVGEAAATGVIPGGGALWVLDSGDDRRTIASWLLVEHLSGISQQIAMHRASGYGPARTDVAADPEVVDFWQTKPPFRRAFDELSGGSDAPQPNRTVGAYHQIDGALISALRATQSGELSVDAAFDQALEDVNALLVAYHESVS